MKCLEVAERQGQSDVLDHFVCKLLNDLHSLGVVPFCAASYFFCSHFRRVLVSLFVDVHPVDKGFGVLESSCFHLGHGRRQDQGRGKTG